MTRGLFRAAGAALVAGALLWIADVVLAPSGSDAERAGAAVRRVAGTAPGGWDALRRRIPRRIRAPGARRGRGRTGGQGGAAADPVGLRSGRPGGRPVRPAAAGRSGGGGSGL